MPDGASRSEVLSGTILPPLTDTSFPSLTATTDPSARAASAAGRRYRPRGCQIAAFAVEDTDQVAFGIADVDLAAGTGQPGRLILFLIAARRRVRSETAAAEAQRSAVGNVEDLNAGCGLEPIGIVGKVAPAVTG